MIQHLESGACSSEVDVYDIKRWCVQVENWRVFVDPTYYASMLDKRPVLGDHYPYKCPECEMKSSRLSGLLQHAEGSSCAFSLEDNIVRDVLSFIIGRWS